jgi:hypothetical protein
VITEGRECERYSFLLFAPAARWQAFPDDRRECVIVARPTQDDFIFSPEGILHRTVYVGKGTANAIHK